ncbi:MULTISPECIES: CARDB domain-containing protein [Halorubrum]|uniref:CARDB domain-containing protein n=1 Tax=Halorubrum TaxID=56688 RepID=UPI001266F57E|nr:MULTISPECIES: CARDB domain-containing protein [Halorubrum]
MNRRGLLISIGAFTALSGCAGVPGDSSGSPESSTSTTGTSSTTEAESVETTEETDTPAPAEINVQNIDVNPPETYPGESTTITVELVNDGGSTGSRDVELLVDGDPYTVKSVRLESGSGTQVQFQLSLDTPGTHELAVGDQAVDFSVLSVTEVGGVIDNDTRWSASDSPFVVTSTVQVREGVSLTIEPGATVLAGDSLDDDSMFLMHGEITAKGSSNNSITFDGRDGRSTFFEAENSPPDAFLDAEYCTIRNGGPFWMRGWGGFHLRRSRLENVGASYVWYPYRGSTAEYETSRTEIRVEYNEFINSGGFAVGTGDRYDDKTVQVLIRHNVFDRGRSATYGGLINNWTSYGSSETIVEYNSFLNMTDEIVLKLPEGYEDAALTGTNNYWGTTNTDTIEGMIFDSNDNINSAGEIPFEPVLEEPHPDTPSL